MYLHLMQANSCSNCDLYIWSDGSLFLVVHNFFYGALNPRICTGKDGYIWNCSSNQDPLPQRFCAFPCLYYFIHNLHRKTKLVVFNEPCWVNLKFIVYLNGCSDDSKPCVITNPSTLRYVWYFYLAQYLRCVQLYCVITTKEWLFTKVICLLLFIMNLDNILKGQHTNIKLKPIPEHSTQYDSFARFI